MAWITNTESCILEKAPNAYFREFKTGSYKRKDGYVQSKLSILGSSPLGGWLRGSDDDVAAKVQASLTELFSAVGNISRYQNNSEVAYMQLDDIK